MFVQRCIIDTRWLEDFLSVADCGNFTRAAQLRHLTQPALSRRIRALESWLGVDLVDRSTYPTRLTRAGEQFRDQAITMLEQLNDARSHVRNQLQTQEGITVALPHTLSLSFFPKWFSRIRELQPGVSARLVAGNVHDAVLHFVENNSDLLMCYHHSLQPVALDKERYSGLRLGVEWIRPYSRCDKQRTPLFALPGTMESPLPFLGYAPGAYLRRMVDMLVEHAPERCFLEQTFETDMSEALKNMALEGHGIAFLPESSVQREVRHGQLTVAGNEAWQASMEIHLYRETRRQQPTVDALWQQLEKHYPAV